MADSFHTDGTTATLDDKLVGETDIYAPAPLSAAIKSRKNLPKSGTRHFVPRDERVEEKLIEVEKLIRGRNYNAAIREAKTIDTADSDLASTYALMINEKITRSQIALGDRYLARQNIAEAKKTYQQAIEALNADAQTKAVAQLTAGVFSQTAKLRAELIDKLRDMLISRQYEQWCETRKRLQDSSILDHIGGIVPDIRLEEALEPRVPPYWPPKNNPKEGWIDPAPIDELVDGDGDGLGSVVLERPALKPGTSFTSLSSKPVSLSTLQKFSMEAGRRTSPAAFAEGQTLLFNASSTLPLMSSMLTAHARLHAMEFALSPLGRAAGSMPIYRYGFLVQEARRILSFVAGIDSRMATMQFELDDFAELVDTVRRQIDESSAELQALNTRVSELQTTVATLSEGNEQLSKVVQELQAAEDACDPEWWEYLVSVLVVIGATALGAVIGFVIGGPVGAVAGGLTSLITSIGLTIQVWNDREITCDNVSQARQDFQSARSALQSALTDTKAELNHALIQRDIVISQLASLQDAYDEAITANQARALNAPTLSHILGVLDGVRSTTILRAHTLARMAQDSYNAENDTQVNIVAASHADYLDQDARGYTAAAVLQRDLDGLEHIRVTGHTRKRMQLSQIVSLSKHYPSSFAALLTSGQARFATRIADFDRWFPGTYMQRLKEVRVEVQIDGEPQPIRGYLTNDGVSFVRFPDHGNKVKIDDRNVYAEPDVELRKLCYKRRRRHHAVETLAFPSSDSFLFEARATELQQQERNFFEGCGLESTWHLELTPDQVLDYAQITDVKIHLQFEALFDPALKRVVEAKRYENRNETALISLRKLLEAKETPVDFSQPLNVDVSTFMFEAPHLTKRIRDVAVMLRPKQAPLLNGVAKLRLGYQDQAPIDVDTGAQGIVATGDTRPAGTNTVALQNMTRGKSAVGSWLLEILELPAGVAATDIDDVLIMMPYSFEAA